MLNKFLNSFSEDVRHDRSLLNDIVDLHAQAADHHRNLADIEILQHPVNVAGIWSNSGQLAKIWSDRPDLAREPDSGRPAGSG